jgi:flagellar biosynthesis protein FlgN
MSALATILDQEIILLSSFIALLEKEQSALKLGESTQLPDICEQKLALIAQLNAQESARGNALQLTADNLHTGTILWLQTHPGDKPAAERWKKMIELARNAKHLHGLNGRLVQMHLQQTNELLASLTRKAEQNTFYGSNGQAHSITGSRLVDSA